MIPMTTAQIRDAVAGVLHGDEALTVTGISTDSRLISPGDWFVPILGERFDGHDYIDKALEAGAVGCFCARLPQALRPDKAYIEAADTKAALRALASWYRGQFDLPVVQVTGSMGKTTFKELLAGILSQRYNTLKTHGNFNGDIGTPLLMLELGPEHQAAVVETGMDALGQIRALGEMVRPDVAVITNVDDVHLEYFNSRDEILQAKAEIFENLRPGGLAVLSGDDERLNTLHPANCQLLRCGLSEGCDVRVTDLEDLGLEGLRFTVVTAKGRYPLALTTPGVHMAGLVSMAVAVAEHMGLTAEEILRGVAAYQPADNRLRVERLAGGRMMINDSYNANPRSVSADLRILAQHKGGKRIAMLGDMKELGVAAQPGHESVGRLVGELGIEVLLAVGPLCREYMVPAAKAAGCPDVRWYEKREDVKDDLLALFGPGDCVLLKASHFFGRFDLMADFLREYTF